MLILCAVNTDMVVFRPFSATVSPRPGIFIIEMNLIINDVVTRKTGPFTNIKSMPSYSVLWRSSSRMSSGMRGTFCTCCVIFRTIFLFRMETIGPYMASALLISLAVTLVLII